MDESPAAAAVRETLEESGYRVKPTRLMALYDRPPLLAEPAFFRVYRVFFECDVIEHAQEPSPLETSAVGFFARDALPPLSEQRVTPQLLLRVFELHSNPSLPPDFE